MAWLWTSLILAYVLTQVFGGQSTSSTDNVEIRFRLNNYSVDTSDWSFKNPWFRVHLDTAKQKCEEEYHDLTMDDFVHFKGNMSNHTTNNHLNLQYGDGQIIFNISRQDYGKTINLYVKQKYRNDNVFEGPDALTYYCSKINTTHIVKDFLLTLESKDHCATCSIDVTLVAKCPEHYFGAQCNTYCVPKDDETNGHYTCGPNGEKECLLGYGGENCTIDIPDCENVTCYHGNCSDKVANFTCECQEGFTGRFCEIDIDNCVHVTCENEGKCKNAIANYSCECKAGFNGSHCENNINDCVNNACKNDGTCHDGIMNYTCECKAGFNGSHCENNIDDCVNNACKNGGTCHDGIMNYTCECKDGFEGNRCEQPSSTQGPPVTHPPKSTFNHGRNSTQKPSVPTTRNVLTTQHQNVSVQQSTNRHEQVSSTVKPPVSMSPNSTYHQEQMSSTVKPPVSISPNSTYYHEQVSSTEKPPVSMSPNSMYYPEQVTSTEKPPVSMSPKSTYHQEQVSSTEKPPVSISPNIDNESSEQKASSVAPIAGGAGGGVLVLVVVVVVVIRWQKKRRRQTSKNQSNGKTSSDSSNGVEFHSNGSYSNGSYSNGSYSNGIHNNGSQNAGDLREKDTEQEKEYWITNTMYQEDEKTQL